MRTSASQFESWLFLLLSIVLGRLSNFLLPRSPCRRVSPLFLCAVIGIEGFGHGQIYFALFDSIYLDHQENRQTCFKLYGEQMVRQGFKTASRPWGCHSYADRERQGEDLPCFHLYVEGGAHLKVTPCFLGWSLVLETGTAYWCWVTGKASRGSGNLWMRKDRSMVGGLNMEG